MPNSGRRAFIHDIQDGQGPDGHPGGTWGAMGGSRARKSWRRAPLGPQDADIKNTADAAIRRIVFHPEMIELPAVPHEK